MSEAVKKLIEDQWNEANDFIEEVSEGLLISWGVTREEMQAEASKHKPHWMK